MHEGPRPFVGPLLRFSRPPVCRRTSSVLSVALCPASGVTSVNSGCLLPRVTLRPKRPNDKTLKVPEDTGKQMSSGCTPKLTTLDQSVHLYVLQASNSVLEVSLLHQ